MFVFVGRRRRGASQPAKSHLPVLRRSNLLPTQFPTHRATDLGRSDNIADTKPNACTDFIALTAPNSFALDSKTQRKADNRAFGLSD